MSYSRPARWLWVVVLFAALVRPAGAETPATAPVGKTVRLLVIGNSFSGNALSFFKPLAEAGGHHLIVTHASINGSSFERHMKSVNAFEADPNDRAGRPYKVPAAGGGSRDASLRELLQEQPWEYVTVQQASPLSYQPATYQPFADQLIAYVRRYAPQAKILVHQTWAYRVDNGLFDKGTLDQWTMYTRLDAAYQSLATHVGAAGIIPSGAAMQNVRQDPRWAERIEYIDPAAVKQGVPQPSHSLNADYYWTSTGGPLRLIPDRFHASTSGRFVVGAVWYEFFFGDVRSNPFTPSDLPAGDVSLFKEIAHKTVAEGLRPKAPATQPATRAARELVPAN